MHPNTDDPAHRISRFCVGAGITAFCAFLVWGSFILLSMLMNPKLTGAEYWAAIFARAQTDRFTSGLLVFFSMGACFGLFMMNRAVLGKRTNVSKS